MPDSTLIALGIGAVVMVFAVMRISMAKSKLVDCGEGIANLRVAFAHSSVPGEADPIMVVALEKVGSRYHQYFLGVTEHRWLAVDAEGQQIEHLRSGAPFIDMYFEDSHYEGHLQPDALHGRTWLFYEKMKGYPQQCTQLKALFDHVGLRWLSGWSC